MLYSVYTITRLNHRYEVSRKSLKSTKSCVMQPKVAQSHITYILAIVIKFATCILTLVVLFLSVTLYII